MNIIKNIKEKKTYKKEFLRLYELFEENVINCGYGYNSFTLKQKINNDFFKSWKHRNTYTDLDELEQDLGLFYCDSEQIEFEEITLEKLLTYCELIANLIDQDDYKINFSLMYEEEYKKQIDYITDQIVNILQTYTNCTIEVINDFTYIIQNGNEVEFLREINNNLSEDVIDKLIEYQLLKNKNNIIEKQGILCTLDVKRQEIMENSKYKGWKIIKQLDDDIGCIMNNCNIRHPNIKQGTNALPDEEKIKFYDLAFRKLLHFFILITSKNEEDIILMKKVKEILSK